MNDDVRIYQIALTMIPGLGCASIRKLLEICPDPMELFNYSHSQLKELFGKHDEIINHIERRTTLQRAEEEVEFANKQQISVLFCLDPNYPQRLNRPGCEDTPVVLYQQGNTDLNASHIVSIVGTRHATEYGREMTDRLVKEMQDNQVVVVSGLAYGIDTASHKAALQYQLPTVGVLGHGLDQLYPAQNKTLALKMIEAGGSLLTEYPSYTKIHPSYFPARNRIIAGLSDATIVVEAAEKGGALITASIANSYHRDVFAVPGRILDTYSKGCNNLIATNKATLIRSTDDLYYMLGWDQKKGAQGVQTELFASLTPDEQQIRQLLTITPELTLDEIAAKSDLSLPKIAAIVLEMELKNLIKCLPGKTYKLI